ncbi:MAG: YggS family pyridoxal phosphate-dependent enzyme [Bacteroidetes bacterium]|nr:YggS family pyridoxal phosphate-dependent enzyme [Bacteroidota bacterium]MDA1383136.1 YggS family pyridoxal phosphate-dependent enzyme [Bacteroidota bacterium]
MDSNTIQTNIQAIRDAVPEHVTLVAVSKTQTLDAIASAYAEGIRDFGENRVTELVEKADAFPDDVRWHAIGHLQTNKAKIVAPLSHLIHAVDSTRIYEALAQHKNASPLDVLLQVHIAEETSKFGFLEDALRELFALPGNDTFGNTSIRIKGLMGMATYTKDTTQIAKEFKGLRSLFEELAPSMGANFDTLSMGMSGDWNIAIDEGSTMIRVGSAIFGART